MGCHDNGPIIRSPYLAQITGPNKLPGAGDFSFNKNKPYAFVGSDFADWKAYQVEVNGNVCISCHRLGVNNQGDGGTARDFGIQATDVTQRHKNPHSIASPIWMKPGQITFEQSSANAAKEIRNCAILFHEGSPLPNSPSCKITLFAKAFEPPRTTTPVSCTVFDDGYSNQSNPIDAIYFAGNSAACTPDGSTRGNCHKWFGRCTTVGSNPQSVNFRIFNDGDSNRTIPFDAIYNNAPNVSCIPNGTPTGDCRRWFGLAESMMADRRSATYSMMGTRIWSVQPMLSTTELPGQSVCLMARQPVRVASGSVDVNCGLEPLNHDQGNAQADSSAVNFRLIIPRVNCAGLKINFAHRESVNGIVAGGI